MIAKLRIKLTVPHGHDIDALVAVEESGGVLTLREQRTRGRRETVAIAATERIAIECLYAAEPGEEPKPA